MAATPGTKHPRHGVTLLSSSSLLLLLPPLPPPPPPPPPRPRPDLGPRRRRRRLYERARKRGLECKRVMSLWRETLARVKHHDGQHGEQRPNSAIVDAPHLAAQTAWLDNEVKKLAAADQRVRRDSFQGNDNGDRHIRAAAIERLAATWHAAVEAASQHASGASQPEETTDSFASRIEEVTESNAHTASATCDEQPLVRRATLAARLLRNVVVGDSKGQGECFSLVVPHVFGVLWISTSFALEGEKDVQLLTRTLVQLLSNLITDNDTLQDRLWSEHLGIVENFAEDIHEATSTGKRRSGSDLLVRLIESQNIGTSLAARVLIINLITDSHKRSRQLVTTRCGSNLLRSLLQLAGDQLEEDEREEEQEDEESAISDGDSGLGIAVRPSQGALQRQQERYESLGILYTITSRLLDQGYLESMFDGLSKTGKAEGPPELDSGASIVTPAQIVLLKILDAHLNSTDARQGGSGLATASLALLQSAAILEEKFRQLARWAEKAMAATLQAAKDSSQTAPAVDTRLVEVHVALILVVQCLTALLVATDKVSLTSSHGMTLESIVAQGRSEAFLSTLLALMRTTNAFAPAISPFAPGKGRAAPPSAALDSSAPKAQREAPVGHVLSSTGRAAAATHEQKEAAERRPRLDKLKRDLVALLSVVSFERESRRRETESAANGPDGDASASPDDERSAVRRVQDTVREKGGLLDVLNMTQLDEHNPYIRERAIFALRNLLKGNQTSQDFIAQIRPIQQQEQPNQGDETTARTGGSSQ